MLRFAASPTGDMHIGDLRVALFNYIISQQKKEDLLIRIEDMDKEKNIEDKDKEILDTLGLFGIEYTQVIYQSESVRFHTAMALQLMHEKKAFSCFCSPEWLEDKGLYDDACANLPAELVIDNTSPFTIRIAKPIQDITLVDRIKGELTFKDLDSFVIMEHNKTPTYNFASAIDDMLNNISLVILSENNIENTPKQDHIRTALNYDRKVEYAHLPNILTDDSISVKGLLEEGFLPEAIANYLLLLGNEIPKEIFTLAEALACLDLSKVSASPTHFDINMLRHINKEHLARLDNKELSRYVGFADEEIGQLAKVYLKEVSTTKELKAKMAAIFDEKEIPKEFSKHSALMIQAIKSASYFEDYDEFKNYIMKETGFNEKNFVKALRYVLTGAGNGPDIAEIYKYLKNYIGEIVK